MICSYCFIPFQSLSSSNLCTATIVNPTTREASEASCAYVKITPAHLRPVCRDDSWIVFWYSEYF